MRTWVGTALVACAVLLAAMRLFTCIIILEDDPTSFLALKRHSSFASVVRVGSEPLRRDYVLLDDDENELVYERPYLFLTGHAPVLAGACVVAGVAVLAWRGRA